MINTKEIFEYDKQFLTDNVKYIAGIDEVGRGPLAGPVVTACVVMPYDEMIDGVFDSKKVTAKNRAKLYNQILSKAISVSVSLADNLRIDAINILNATKECMADCFAHSKVKPDLLLVDAVRLNICENEKPIIKGDATSYAIACASIVAKVYRDNLMVEYAKNIQTMILNIMLVMAQKTYRSNQTKWNNINSQIEFFKQHYRRK